MVLKSSSCQYPNYMYLYMFSINLAYLGHNILIVDLRGYLFIFRIWGGDDKKGSENGQLIGHFQSFFFIFRAFFISYLQKKSVKLVR